MKIYKNNIKTSYKGKNVENNIKINYSKDKPSMSEIQISKLNLMHRDINNYDFIFAKNWIIFEKERNFLPTQ